MYSEVRICNIALSNVGGNPIQSFSDKTREAQLCREKYEICRDMLLREHRWSFATKNIVLAQLKEQFGQWDYAYSYPADCLNIINVYSARRNERTEYDVVSSGTNSQKVIVTNEMRAEAEYTARIRDSNLYDPLFVDALAWILSAHIAIPLKRTELYQSLMQHYQWSAGRAKYADAQERYIKEEPQCSYLEVR